MVLVVTTGGCIAGIVPPTRSEIGSTVITDSGQPRSGVRVASGVHLASGTLNRDQDIDVGIGYVYERQSAPAETSVALSAMPPAEQGAPVVDGHGLYIEVAHAIDRQRSRRGWLAARAELLRQASSDGARDIGGVYGRASWELFGAGEGGGSASDACTIGAGFARGTYAVGLFLESGVRMVEDRGTAFVATAGLTMRLPMFGGFAVNLCPRC